MKRISKKYVEWIIIGSTVAGILLVVAFFIGLIS